MCDLLQMLSKISTEDLLRELYERMDDNLYASERKDDEYLDSIDDIEKQTLCQALRLTYEEYQS